MHGARRLWKLRLDSCRLMDLENQVLGVEREGDLPGEMIPYCYFDFLRSRHAFKVATAWLLVVAALFAAGLSTAALSLGAMLLAACAAVTVFNLCIPSMVLSLLERRRPPEATPA